MNIDDKNKKISIKPILVDHGKVKSNWFIIDKKLAYISDISDISNKDFKYFKNLKYLIIDCLWYNFHPSHFNLEKSLFFIKKFNPSKAILTNLSPVLDYNELKKLLPKNVSPAYDGLTINL
jgi:phosphoribosyl 1,2-cyclic phosphate phosphodiesterase